MDMRFFQIGCLTLWVVDCLLPGDPTVLWCKLSKFEFATRQFAAANAHSVTVLGFSVPK